MGGFNSTFVRIPDGSDAWEFAVHIARLLHDSPYVPCKGAVDVQHAESFPWLHIEGLEIPGDTNKADHPAFRSASLETIWLLCHSGSGSHAYIHCINGKCCRIISVSDGKVYEDSGIQESWEQQARAEKLDQYTRWGDANSFSWPKAFDTDMVLEAFILPSPWSGGDLEDLDICICVSNPDENDMTRALPE